MSGLQDPSIYRSILESLQTGVCVVDLEKRILFWNDGAERITGYLRHEVMGRSCAENILLHCHHPECECCADQCPLSTALQQSRPVEGTGSFHHKSGYRAPVHIWAMPVRDARGMVIGAMQNFDRMAHTPDRRSSLDPYGWQDAVTGVANRAMMQSRLREAISLFVEMRVPFGIVCLHLDEVSQIRAKYGQEAVTSLLRAVAQTLENTLRPTDFVGRWSEDQFMAIVTNCNEAALPSICQRVRQMISGDSIEWWGNLLSPGAFSMGHSGVQDEDSVERMVDRAQQSLRKLDHAQDKPAGEGGGEGTSS